jgi:hypothetical protein
MSSKSVTLIILLVMSLAVGVGIGETFYRLYVSAIPPVGQSAFTAQASHVAHLGYGAGVGIVLYLWAFLGMAAGGLMKKLGKSDTPKS